MRRMTKKEIKIVQLEILDYIDGICKANGIQYSLAFGTLLGAVRHRGYIPWDDDIDIMMLRRDYRHFVKCIENDELNKGRYYLAAFENSDRMPGAFSKIVNKETTLIRKNASMSYRNQGVSVDIFIYDYLRDDKRNYVLRSLITIIVLKLYRISCFEKRNEIRGRFIFIKSLLWQFVRQVGTEKWIELFMKNWEGVIDRNRSEYCGKAYPVGYIYSSTIFDEFVDLEFEGKAYPCIAQWDSYLQKVYGAYMKYPPSYKRYGHPGVYAYWRI